jgi:hypothetical protein
MSSTTTPPHPTTCTGWSRPGVGRVSPFPSGHLADPGVKDFRELRPAPSLEIAGVEDLPLPGLDQACIPAGILEATFRARAAFADVGINSIMPPPGYVDVVDDDMPNAPTAA